jgi:hypothetical protein
MYRNSRIILESVTYFETTFNRFIILKIVGKPKRPQMATQKSALFATREIKAREDTQII